MVELKPASGVDAPELCPRAPGGSVILGRHPHPLLGFVFVLSQPFLAQEWGIWCLELPCDCSPVGPAALSPGRASHPVFPSIWLFCPLGVAQLR
jgi:hypothetical protein